MSSGDRDGCVQRLVERVEVVPDGLHLPAVDDLVAEAEEDVLGLADDLREGMEVPERRAVSGQRDVEALGRVEPACPLERRLPLVDRSLEALAHGVQRHAGLAVAHLPQRELQLALAAEEPDAQTLERVEGIGRLDRAQSLVLERLGVHPPTVPSAFVTSPYDPFAAVYDIWASDMTEDVPYYVELAREAPEGPIVELAVGNGRVADARGAGDRSARDRHRRHSGRCSPRLACGRSRRAPTSTSARETCASFELEEPAALVYCPFRSLLHLPTWHDKRRVFERVAANLAPGGRFAWNAFCFDHTIAARLDGTQAGGAGPAHDPPCARATTASTSSSTRAARSRSGG